MPYNHKNIEQKWQKVWDKNKLYSAKDFVKKTKFYGLIEFPYPSGDGLHVGHIRSNTAMDIICRKRRMEGYNVLYPIGWDAFGLPTENYAIKTGVHPKIVTKKNTDIFRRQLKSLGFSFDWNREINTTDPNYYKWTQWIFLQFYKHGLAYKKKMPINWCPSCKIGLANEEVLNGKCERCGTQTEKKEKEQWMLAITKYADRLLEDLKTDDYLEKIKIQQANWIGRSEGTMIKFQITNSKSQIDVFTTRPDTLFGATYLVLSPEHSLIENLKLKIKNFDEVKKYIDETHKKSDLERTELTKDKTGIELKGMKAINPANKEEIPIFIADYVLASYGTGAIMAVPAHDERDFEFAKKFKLPIKMVICPNYPEKICPILNKAYEGNGFLIDSGKFNGMLSKEAKTAITKFVGGKKSINYKLRDWIFSRQHYWGEPIPIVFCEKCGEVPVSEKDLPVKLPNVKNYKPTNTGESPLSSIKNWVNIKCPKCGEKAKRETDTMPNWAGSSWYYIAYCISENLKSQAPISKQFSNPKIQNKIKYWMPVDWYNGGMEHTTLHLLYSRFWHKFLYDIKIVPTNEPYQKRTSHGMILGEGGEKMSKSKGNVINPDALVKTFGADSVRLYEMFMGPFDQAITWNNQGIGGCYRFLNKVWNIYQNKNISDKIKNNDLEILIHQTIKKAGEDIEKMNFNTAISALMILVNKMEELTEISKRDFEILLRLLAPFAPYITEELWSVLRHKTSIHLEGWPDYDKILIQAKNFELIIQINGKVRDKFEASFNISEKEVTNLTLSRNNVQKWLGGKIIKKIIFVPNKLMNIVT